MRAASVIAAVSTVAAVYWIANRLAGRLVACVAALLAAVSPLVLEYEGLGFNLQYYLGRFLPRNALAPLTRGWDP